MKIIIVTQYDPYYVDAFLRELIEIKRDCKEMPEIGIYFLSNFNENKLELAKRMLNFYGYKDFMRLALMMMAAKAKRKKRKTYKDLERHNIKWEHIKDINSEEIYNRINDEEDLKLVASVSSPQIFKKRLINIKHSEFVNIHSANLPSYRGMMPNFWQKLERQGKTSIT